MRLEIKTEKVRFRAAGPVTPRKDPRNRDAQAHTPDGRPIWTVRLDAIEDEQCRKENIWVEVAGDEPKLTFDGYVQVDALVFAPWVNRDTHKIMRSFRADRITDAEPASRRPAA
jgi:hypothetical protein